MTNLQSQFNTLIQEHGEDAVTRAAEIMLARLPQVPAQYTPIISVEKLHETISMLDSGAADIIEKAQARETVYGDRVALIKRKRELETAVDLGEAEAFMSIRGESRSQYVMIGGEKVPLSNEEARKAYARTSTKELREELAQVEGELSQLDVKAFWKKDEYEAAVKAADIVQARAAVQAGLLNMLGHRA